MKVSSMYFAMTIPAMIDIITMQTMIEINFKEHMSTKRIYADPKQ